MLACSCVSWLESNQILPTVNKKGDALMRSVKIWTLTKDSCRDLAANKKCDLAESNHNSPKWHRRLAWKQKLHLKWCTSYKMKIRKSEHQNMWHWRLVPPQGVIYITQTWQGASVMSLHDSSLSVEPVGKINSCHSQSGEEENSFFLTKKSFSVALRSSFNKETSTLD